MAQPLSLMFVITILFTVAFVNCQPNITNFLECLNTTSKFPNPILENVYTRDNYSFVSILHAYVKNRRFLSPKIPRPIAIVAPKAEEHVQATVICAKSNGLQIRTRSGGHDYEALSYTSNVPFVVIDLFNMNRVLVNLSSHTAKVQAGAILGELYYKIGTTSNNSAFPAGVSHTVGTGGHFSGGGYGKLTRKYGMSADNIINARIVDVKGRILDRKAMGEDLFWAIRGGGGASFGVIVEWVLNLVYVPEKVTVFRTSRGLHQGATNIVYRWQQVAPKIDNDLFIRVTSMVVNGSKVGEKKVENEFLGMYLGLTDPLLALLKKGFPELGLKKEECKEMSWLESVLFWGNIPEGTPIEILKQRLVQAKAFSKSKTDYVKKVIPKSGLESMWKWLVQYDIRYTIWNPYGGRMNEIPEDEIAFPHRAGNLFLIQYTNVWTNESDTEKQMCFSRKMYKAMTRYVSRNPREVYLNYRDIEIGSNPCNFTGLKKAQVYGEKYFKDNFLRLKNVKAKVDPDNFFKNEQSIPPLYSSS